jgi:hypothetical protein
MAGLSNGVKILYILDREKNQPFDFPRSKARGLLRVDTGRRQPHLQGGDLALSKHQEIPLTLPLSPLGRGEG